MQRQKTGGMLRLMLVAGLMAAGAVLLFRFTDSPPPREATPPRVPETVAANTHLLTFSEVRQVDIQPGETFVAALGRLGFSPTDAHRTARTLSPVYPVARVHPGRRLSVTFREDRPSKLVYEIDAASRLLARWGQDNEMTAHVHTEPFETRLAYVKGEISSSLFAGILAAGEDAALADLLASLFEFDVDFNRDIRVGDTFEILVEKRFLREKFHAYGAVHAATVTNRGNTIQVVRYMDAGDNPAYFHPDGRSVRKMFLRCPLPFMRVTSGYGNRRHPVLGFSARHNGIDLGAPRGTPVKATATGVVTHAGVHSLKGRYVQLRHPNSYETHYYHLSGIRSGVRRGQRVSQGDVIGYVGSTGLSTGPHLHYGIRHNERFINPLQLRPPSKKPIAPAELDAFKLHCNQVFFTMSAFAWVEKTAVARLTPAATPARVTEETPPIGDAFHLPLVPATGLEALPRK